VSGTKLSVNVNKFALLRNSRDTDYPNLRRMASRAIAAGAHGITVHPRPDQRHVRYADVPVLGDLVAEHPEVEYNIEGNPTPEFVRLVVDVAPDQVTLVPDDPGQLTSDHGWNLENSLRSLVPVIDEFHEHGIRVSLFMDPAPDAIARVSETGADRIELYTESYARAFGTDREDAVWEGFRRSAARATECGLGVNAGHDLNLQNLGRFLEVDGVLEVSIGHAIVVESFDYGFEETLRRYLGIPRMAPLFR
jgi:pyridoxine 5-phosphate synthase